MKAYQYLVEKKSWPNAEEDLAYRLDLETTYLNRKGESGWKLSIMKGDRLGNVTYYFEREKKV